MKEPIQLWQLDRLATRYNCRPSDLLELDDSYKAYCLDQAVLVFVAGVEKKIEDEPTPKGKRGDERRKANQQTLLNRLLRIPEEEKKAASFKDPGSMFKRH